MSNLFAALMAPLLLAPSLPTQTATPLQGQPIIFKQAVYGPSWGQKDLGSLSRSGPSERRRDYLHRQT